jgi:hypothetical protein
VTAPPVSSLERLETIVANPATYALADTIDEIDRPTCGRPRQYPSYMLVIYEALISVYGSARQVEAEITHPLVWQRIRDGVIQQLGKDAALALWASPMRRHHYLYARKRCLKHPGLLERLMSEHRRLAAAQAAELGLCDPLRPRIMDAPAPRPHAARRRQSRRAALPRQT